MSVARYESWFSASTRRALLDLRHDLHRHPELSSQEHRTAERLEAALRPLRPALLQRVAGTGVLVRIAGRDRKAPVVAIRGDIDALPIQEETGLPYASQHAGVMHACGHDVHATWAVAAARLLTARRATGDVLIILQPAEETGKGAALVIKSGVLDGVAAMFGGHVDRRFPVGAVVADAGPLAASADTFTIELIGSGAHGARPHEGKDPIVGAGALIGALQTIVARRLNPATPAVVSIGTVQAGTASNVIPDRARLTGTLRALEGETRRFLLEEVRRIAEQSAMAYGLKAHVVFELGPPPVVNPPGAVAWARQAVASVLGDGALTPLGFLNLAAEDFSWYLEKTTGCFLRIGAREANGVPIPAHTSRFYAADEAIFIGAAVLAETARVASAALATASSRSAPRPTGRSGGKAVRRSTGPRTSRGTKAKRPQRLRQHPPGKR